MSKLWEGRAFCLITGASRGIGQAIAVEFGRRMEKGSAIFIMSRDVKGMDETKAMVAKAAPHVSLVAESVDLGNYDASTFLQAINSALSKLGSRASDFQHAIIVHNSASKGGNKGVADIDQASEMQEYFNLNVFSAVCLNSQFLKVFNEAAVDKRTVVQVTSRASHQPMPTNSLYASGKVARDMIFKTFAMENPKINVICYAPGVVATKLMYEFASSMEEVGMRSETFTKSKYVLSPIASAQKLVQILEEGKYNSGDHVDAYDDPEKVYGSLVPAEYM